MAATDEYTIVYNSGNDTVELWEDGQLLGPRDWACARRTDVSSWLGSGTLVEISPDTIVEHMSNPLAWVAKQAYDKAVADYDAAQPEAKNDYDESTAATTSKTTTSKPKK